MKWLKQLFTRLKEFSMELSKEELKKLSPVARYRYYRDNIETKYFVPENESKEHHREVMSPSGRYRLVLDVYSTKPGCWSYSRGRMYAGEKLVADVKRNYSHFPFAWAEGHANGHDYLLCGEDYQGYTVVELDTGRRNDLLPESVPKSYTYKEKDGTEKTGVVDMYPNGYGFCWAGIHPSPDRRVIAVEGCYWAAPYEVVLYDFSEPMQFPLWELERWEDSEGFESWETEGKLLLARTIDVRKSDNKPIDDLPQEEWPENDADWGELKLTKMWEPKSLPMVRSTVARQEYERLAEILQRYENTSEAADVVRDLMDRPWRAMSEADRDAAQKEVRS